MRISFLSVSAGLGGAERVLLDSIAALRTRHAQWTLSVVCLAEGPLAAEVAALGADVRVLPMPPGFAARRRVRRLRSGHAGSARGKRLAAAVLYAPPACSSLGVGPGHRPRERPQGPRARRMGVASLRPPRLARARLRLHAPGVVRPAPPPRPPRSGRRGQLARCRGRRTNRSRRAGTRGGRPQRRRHAAVPSHRRHHRSRCRGRPAAGAGRHAPGRPRRHVRPVEGTRDVPACARDRRRRRRPGLRRGRADLRDERQPAHA